MAVSRSENKPEKKSGHDAQSLHALIAELTGMIEELRREVKALREENAQLRSGLQEAQRAALRQAAPFRIKENKRVENPKPPGRKKGHEGSCRSRPPKVDRKVEVGTGSLSALWRQELCRGQCPLSVDRRDSPDYSGSHRVSYLRRTLPAMSKQSTLYPSVASFHRRRSSGDSSGAARPWRWPQI